LSTGLAESLGLKMSFFPLIHDPETFVNLLPRQSASADLWIIEELCSETIFS
jgi:hypothetical protein